MTSALSSHGSSLIETGGALLSGGSSPAIKWRMHGQSTTCTTSILFYLSIGSVSKQVVQSGNCLLSGNFAQLFKSVDCSNDYLTGLIFQQGNEQVGGARVVAVPQPIDEAKASLKGH